MTVEDILSIKALDESKKKDGHSGERGTALGFGIGAAALVIVGVPVAMVYANARAKAAEEKAAATVLLIQQQANHTQQIETMLAGQIATNRSTFEASKAAQDEINLTVSTNQSGSQSTTTSANALAQAEASVFTGLLTGSYQAAPQKVQWVSEQVCQCPGSCNG